MDNNGNVAGSDCGQSRDSLYQQIYEEWDKLAGLAYNGYLECGRGVVVIKEQEALLVEGATTVSVEFVAARDQEPVERGGWCDESVARGVKDYDPRNEFLCMILGLLENTFLKIRTLPGRLTPRAVIYKSAYERAGASLPHCESPLGPLGSEQDQSPAAGVGEILELMVQEAQWLASITSKPSIRGVSN